MFNYLDFEKPVADLEGKILELKKLSESGEAVDVGDEIARLEKRSVDALRDAYRNLTPWQKVQVARHPDRPHCPGSWLSRAQTPASHNDPRPSRQADDAG